MKKLLTSVLALAMCLSLAACGNQSGPSQSSSSGKSDGAAQSGFEKMTIKVSYSTGDNGLDGIACAKLKELVAEQTGGAVTIEGYGNAQLAGGDMDRMVELLIQGGAYDMCILSEAVMESINPEFYILESPFVFKSYEDAYERIDSEEGQQWLKDEFEKTGLTYLASLGNGILQMTNSKHPVYEPADLADLRFRVYGDNDMRLIKALGGDAFVMSFSELYSALQQKTVDGQINGLATIASANLQEVQSYCTIMNMSLSTFHIVCNTNAWGGYSEELRQILEQSAKQAAQYAREELSSQEAGLRSEFEAQGMTFCDLTDEQLDAFKELARPVTEENLAGMDEKTLQVWGLDS